MFLEEPDLLNTLKAVADNIKPFELSHNQLLLLNKRITLTLHPWTKKWPSG